MLLHEAMARAAEAEEKIFGDATANILRKPMCEENNENEYKIKLSGDDQRHFQDLMRKEAKSGNGQSKIIKNFDFFAKKIKSLSSEEAMHFYKGLKGLQAVWILLDPSNGDDDPQYVFENMNFKGQRLVASDLVRNHLIMKLPAEKQEELYKEYWCRLEENLRVGNGWLDFFIRDYLVAKKGASVGQKGSNKNYDEFRKFLAQDEARRVLVDMKIKSDYYSNIVSPKSRGALKHALEDWNRLNAKEGPTPLLLVLYERFADEAFNGPEFVKIIRLIESYVFRRWACDLRTNLRDEVFRDLIKKINSKELGPDGYYTSLKRYFQSLSEKDENSAKRFPNDKEFIEGLANKRNFYGRANTQCFYALIRLEHQGQESEGARTEDLDIEHIMPQTLSAKWEENLGDGHEELHAKYLHSLGNLTLTGYNSKLGNKTFLEKRKCKKGFDESHLRLNQYLKTLEVWNQEEIEKRANMLAKQAAKIWVAL